MKPGSDRIRRQYLYSENEIFLNTAAFGKISQPVAEAGTNWLQKYREDSNFVLEWLENRYPEIRNSVADFLNTKPKNISLQPNFSIGLNVILESLAPKSALLYDMDYPSLRLPFELKGIDLIYAENDEGKLNDEEFIEAIDEHKPSIVALSHVQFLSGQRTNLKRISERCKLTGSLLLVDTTQSLGICNIEEFSCADIHIGSTYKWLGVGYGNAIMYVGDKVLDSVFPKIAGFGSMSFVDGQPVYKPSIRSYEPGHHNWMTLEMLSAALDFHKEVGPTSIHEHGQRLCTDFHDLLQEQAVHPVVERIGDGSPIIAYKLGSEMKTELLSNDVIFAERGGACRFSFHCYNTEEEVERVVRILTQ